MATAKKNVKTDLETRIEAMTRKSLEDYGGPNPKQLAKAQEALKAILVAKFPKDELDDCPTCKLASPVSLNSCPYCGEEFGEDDEHKRVDEALGGPAEEVEETKSNVTSLDAIKKAKSKKAGTIKVADDGTVKIDNRKLSKEGKAALKAETQKRLQEVVTDEFVSESKPVETASEALQAIIVKSHEKELHDALEKIRALQIESFGSWWEIGRELSTIYINDLWKGMRTIEGEPLYRNWKQFVEGETSLSDPMARIYMSAARFTKEQALQLGVAKISMIDTVADTGRPALLESAKHMSLRELARAAREARVEHGTSERGKRKLAANSEENLAKRKAEREERKRALAGADDPALITLVMPTFESGDYEIPEEDDRKHLIEFDIVANNGAVMTITVDTLSNTWSAATERDAS